MQLARTRVGARQCVARARGGDQRGEPVEFIDEALKIVKETVGVIRDMLHGVNLEGIATDAKKALVALPLAMNHLVKLNQKPEGAPQDTKPPGVKRFLDQVTKLSKAQALAGTHPPRSAWPSATSTSPR